MEGYFDLDDVKAFVYLSALGDEKNKMMVSDEQLAVVHKGQREVFDLQKIIALKPDNKKLLLPLVLGGIVVPFAFLSYFANLFHPWLHLILIMLGGYMFFIGWSGKAVCAIMLGHGNERLYYLPEISKNLEAFMNYVNSLISEPTKMSQLVFFEVSDEDIGTLFSANETDQKSPHFPWIGYTFSQYQSLIKTNHAQTIVSIDPLKAGREIKFEFNQITKEMHPKVDGPMSRDALVKVINKPM